MDYAILVVGAVVMLAPAALIVALSIRHSKLMKLKPKADTPAADIFGKWRSLMLQSTGWGIAVLCLAICLQFVLAGISWEWRQLSWVACGVALLVPLIYGSRARSLAKANGFSTRDALRKRVSLSGDEIVVKE